MAVAYQDYVLVNLLLRKGADPNLANNSKVTPTLLAAQLKMPEILKAVVAHGGIYNAADVSEIQEKLPVNLADSVKSSIFGNVDNLKQKRDLFKQMMEATSFPIYNAAYLGLLNPVSDHLSLENCNMADKQGHTLLMKASYKGHIDIVTLLISSKKMDIEAVDRFGGTALVWAILGRQNTIAKMLIEAGAQVNGKLIKLKETYKILITPLVAACYTGQSDIANVLLKSNANIDEKLANNHTALMIACLMRHKPIIQTLLDKNANYDPKIDEWLKLQHSSNVQNPWFAPSFRRESSSKLPGSSAGSSFDDIKEMLLKKDGSPDKEEPQTANNRTSILRPRKNQGAFRQAMNFDVL